MMLLGKQLQAFNKIIGKLNDVINGPDKTLVALADI